MATSKTPKPVQLNDFEVSNLADVMASVKRFVLDASLRVDDIQFDVSSDDGDGSVTRIGRVGVTVDSDYDVDVQFYPATT